MLIVGFFLGAYLVFVFVDILPIYHDKQKKLLWAYIALIIISFTINFLYALDVKIPSPAIPLKNIVTKVFGLE